MSRNELLGNILYDFTLFFLLLSITKTFPYLFPNIPKKVWDYIYYIYNKNKYNFVHIWNM